MPDTTIVLAGLIGLLGILVSAYVKHYAKAAQGWAIAITALAVLLVGWREWFGGRHWPEASIRLSVAIGVSLAVCFLIYGWPGWAREKSKAEQCRQLGLLIDRYHRAINVASEAGFTNEAMARLKDETRRVAYWLKSNLGAPHHELFNSASPVMEAYTVVPPDRMVHWQAAVGRLRHLQAEAQRRCN